MPPDTKLPDKVELIKEKEEKVEEVKQSKVEKTGNKKDKDAPEG